MSLFIYFWDILFFCARIISLIGFCVIIIQKSACAAFLANDVLYFIPKHWLQFVYPKVSHGFFFCVFLLQCLQMDADSDHQRSGNHGEDRDTDKSKDRMKFKNRRKVLRLNSPAPPNGGSDESDGHDSDYVPSSPVQAGIAAEGSNRKRHHK